MPEFKADLLARPLIKVAVTAIAVSTIDWGGLTRELLVTFASVGRSQFMRALQPLFIVKGTDLFIALRCSVSTQNFACKDRCERRYRRWGFRKDCRGAWEQVDDQRKVERLPDQDL